MAQQYTKYQVGDTIEFPNATEKRPNNFAKIVGIETNLQGRPTHYQMKFTHRNLYTEGRTPTRFPITSIDNQTELVTDLPAGADCPAGGPSAKELQRRRGGKTGKTRKSRKLRKTRKTRKHKRKRRI
jgi:hypothetical protein